MCCHELSGQKIKRFAEQFLHQKEIAPKTREKDLASHAQMNNHQQQQLFLQTTGATDAAVNGFVAETYYTAIFVTKDVEENVLICILFIL